MAPQDDLSLLEFEVHTSGIFYINNPLKYINRLLFHLRLPRYERVDYETLYDFLNDKTDRHMY